MTEKKTQPDNHNTLRIPSREEFHRHFGGKLYESDFCTEHPRTYKETKGSSIASKIAEDYKQEYDLYIENKMRKERQKNHDK